MIMFAVLQVDKSVEISIMAAIMEVPLSYADGMIGAIPVFETKEQADKFSNGQFEVVELIYKHKKGG